MGELQIVLEQEMKEAHEKKENVVHWQCKKSLAQEKKNWREWGKEKPLTAIAKNQRRSGIITG